MSENKENKEIKIERTYKPSKVNYVNSFKTACAEYKKILFVSANNVGSKQMAEIRLLMRPLGATLLMGKNTLMKTAIKKSIEKNPKLKAILPEIIGNCGLIFTNGNLSELKKLISSNKVQSAAKPGAIAQTVVIIPAQNTGMEPTKTSFFQALDIPTKITRGTVEIINDFPLLQPGDKVSASQAQLLQILSIYPLSYGLEVYSVYDDGEVYSPDVLDLTDDDLVDGFHWATSELAALSLELDLVNEATVPHSVANSFKDLLSIAIETDYKFKEAEKVIEYLKDPSKFASVSSTTGGDKKVEEKVEEEEEEEEEEEAGGMAGGLFGDDDSDEDEDSE